MSRISLNSDRSRTDRDARDYDASDLVRDSSVRGRLLELSSKNRHHLENTDARMIVMSNLCPESPSTEIVGVLKGTHEIMMRPNLCRKALREEFYSSYLRRKPTSSAKVGLKASTRLGHNFYNIHPFDLTSRWRVLITS